MLAEDQIERYARHVLLREVGGAGQRRLLASCVRIHGLDAPGAWAAAYLALAGVGRIELDDPHPVDDLLPLLDPEDMGRPRAVALARALPAWNPDVHAGPPLDRAPDLVLRRDGAGGGGTVILLAGGAEVLVAGGETCAVCRSALRPPASDPDPAAAVLAGSVAASEVVVRLLGLSGPRLLRLSGGRPVEVPPCRH